MPGDSSLLLHTIFYFQKVKLILITLCLFLTDTFLIGEKYLEPTN